MSARRQELRALLETYYRGCGWKLGAADDGTVRAIGLGGVTWIGLPVVADDLADPGFEGRLLDRLRLGDRGHVEVYSVAA